VGIEAILYHLHSLLHIYVEDSWQKWDSLTDEHAQI
jgi:hypothetical protein